MFRAILWNFYAIVTHVHSLLANALHFIAQYNSIAFAMFHNEIIEHHTAIDLLDGTNDISVGFQLLNGIGHMTVVAPLHRILGTKRSLMDVGVRRSSSYSA